MDYFERNALDEGIVSDYENNPCTRVEKMTPLDFTAKINDDLFDDQDDWVRAIELPKA